jgi:hypothetical protein
MEVVMRGSNMEGSEKPPAFSFALMVNSAV